MLIERECGFLVYDTSGLRWEVSGEVISVRANANPHLISIAGDGFIFPC